jgi:hypothetical protein
MKGLLSMALLAITGSASAQRGGTLSSRVSPAAVEVHGDTVRVAYAVSNASASTAPLFIFTVDAPAPLVNVEKPARATGWMMDASQEFGGRAVASWGFIQPTLAAGRTSPALAYSARGLPGLVTYWAVPYVPPDTIETPDVAGTDTASGPGAMATDSGVTVGVVPFPNPRDRASLLRRMTALLSEACARGWIDNEGICTSLDTKIRHDLMEPLLNELQAQRGQHVNELAYLLLAANAKALPVR